VWFGSVASMLLARISQVLMVPLSSAEDLGLFSVAVTVSDVPIIVAGAMAGALLGVNSRSSDPVQVAKASRFALLLTLTGCGALAALSPWGVPYLFGTDFAAAVVPTLMLLGAAVLCVPGFMVGAGLAAFGRPSLRSAGFTTTLIVNLTAFVLLVPPLGAIGACWAAIAGNIVMSAFMVIAASRVMHQPIHSFMVIRLADVALVWREVTGLLQRVLRRSYTGA
jgi:O-antigen/teichoic acid export membrane protein